MRHKYQFFQNVCHDSCFSVAGFLLLNHAKFDQNEAMEC